MPRARLSMESLERYIDDYIEKGVKLFKAKKQIFGAFVLVVMILFSSQIINYGRTKVLDPIMTAVDNGVSSKSIAHAFALGVCSGLRYINT
jgi:hypothetical protein